MTADDTKLRTFDPHFCLADWRGFSVHLSKTVKGRGGLGSVFVWASGNGGAQMDNCNCDGYANSPFTLAVSSASERGLVPWYSEACAASLAATFSSGAPDERLVVRAQAQRFPDTTASLRQVTTDAGDGCTQRHTGTSASAPLLAGMVALALQARPSLTWRDVQHLVVRAARPSFLRAPDWRQNGARLNASHRFGFGLLDALEMVRLARRWRGSGRRLTCRLPASALASVFVFDSPFHQSRFWAARWARARSANTE